VPPTETDSAERTLLRDKYAKLVDRVALVVMVLED